MKSHSFKQSSSSWIFVCLALTLAVWLLFQSTVFKAQTAGKESVLYTFAVPPIAAPPIIGDTSKPLNLKQTPEQERQKKEQQKILKEPFFEKQTISLMLESDSAKEVHAGALASLESRKLFAVWYGGSREGARDVELFSSIYTNEWSVPRSIMTTNTLEQQLGRTIKKLGNPVTIVDQDDKLWVFFVSVSVGGWAGSAINAMYSLDHGQSFSPPKRLVTSGFLNISTLVKNPPFLYANGDIGLPVYHEFIGKFSEVLRVNTSGTVVYKHRISHGDKALQPNIAIHSPLVASLWQRNSDKTQGRILVSSTLDGGKTWTPTIPTALPNPDASIAGIGLPFAKNTSPLDAQTLIVYNPSTVDRRQLSLAVTDRVGASFTHLIDLEFGAPDERYSYPHLIREPSSPYYDLLYTSNRATIEHIRFNDAWINQQLLEKGLEPVPLGDWLNTDKGKRLADSELEQKPATYRQRQEDEFAHDAYFVRTLPLAMMVFAMLWPFFLKPWQSLTQGRAGAVGQQYYVAFVFVLLCAVLHSPLLGKGAEMSLISGLRGLFGDLSSASWVLFGYYLCQAWVGQSFQSSVAIQQARRGFLALVVIISIGYFPFAMGWGPYDPYQLGYMLSPYFFFWLLSVAALVCFFGNIAIALWITLALLFFSFGALESANGWDALIDPVAAVVGIFILLRYMTRSVFWFFSPNRSRPKYEN